MRTLPLLLGALGVCESHRLATRQSLSCAVASSTTSRSRLAAIRLSQDDDDDSPEDLPELVPGEDSAAVNDFRAQLLKQFGGGGDDSAPTAPTAPAAPAPTTPDFFPSTAPAQPAEAAIPLVETKTLQRGAVLIGDPAKFCSRNPFAQPVKDLGRFGLQGPIDIGEVSPDDAAQMLPVLVLIEHEQGKGSKALLLERRTGALMGDISMDDFGCVAISPLWLGGKANSNNLYVLHTCEGVEGAEAVCEGLYLGGWADAQPKVAESTLAEGRFKFFLGATVWEGDQLQKELDAGAWVVLEPAPQNVIKDRILNWKPGRPKPVWTEILQELGDARKEMLETVYPPEK